jgi:hypothetical protein
MTRTKVIRRFIATRPVGCEAGLFRFDPDRGILGIAALAGGVEEVVHYDL